MKKIILMSAFFCTSVFADFVGFDTSFGNFVVHKEKDGLYGVQTYKFNGEVLGRTEFVDVDVKKLGGQTDSSIFLLSAATGGSACGESLSVVTVDSSGVTFSPQLNACGGVLNVSQSYGDVVVKVLDRDEATKVVYKVNGSNVLVDGVAMENNFSFLIDY